MQYVNEGSLLQGVIIGRLSKKAKSNEKENSVRIVTSIRIPSRTFKCTYTYTYIQQNIETYTQASTYYTKVNSYLSKDLPLKC